MNIIMAQSYSDRLVYQYLETLDERTTAKKIANALTMPPATVRACLYRLQRTGYISITSYGRNGSKIAVHGRKQEH